MTDRRSNVSAAFRHTIGVIGSVLSTSVFAVLIVVAVALLVVPAITGSQALIVQTSSMEPTLPAGTIVVVRPMPIDDISPGDVVTYQLHSGEPQVVTHRVVQKQLLVDGTPVVFTQGDANDQPDPDVITADRIRGTVWYSIPWIGWLPTLLSGELRFIIIGGVAAALLMYAATMFGGALREGPRYKRRSGEAAKPHDWTPIMTAHRKLGKVGALSQPLATTPSAPRCSRGGR